MAPESQQRLRSLLAAYNVLSAKQRHNKVRPSGASLTANNTKSTSTLCSVPGSACAHDDPMCAGRGQLVKLRYVSRCRPVAVSHPIRMVVRTMPEQRRRPSAGLQWRARWRCLRHSGSPC